MTDTSHHDDTVANMTFGSVYPHCVTKIKKKDRSIETLHQVIKWLTGYTDKRLEKLIKDEVTFEGFFEKAKLNPNAHLITGVICGHHAALARGHEL